VVALACCLHGSGARGCPDPPAVVSPNDDLDVGERTRVDAHDVRALPSGRARGSSSSSRSIITAVRHDDDEEDDDEGNVGEITTEIEKNLSVDAASLMGKRRLVFIFGLAAVEGQKRRIRERSCVYTTRVSHVSQQGCLVAGCLRAFDPS
jgi:hypothetical protein